MQRSLRRVPRRYAARAYVVLYGCRVETAVPAMARTAGEEQSCATEIQRIRQHASCNRVSACQMRLEVDDKPTHYGVHRSVALRASLGCSILLTLWTTSACTMGSTRPVWEPAHEMGPRRAIDFPRRPPAILRLAGRRIDAILIKQKASPVPSDATDSKRL